MARYPGARWRPLPDHTVPIRPIQAILHSAVSNASSLYPYFSRSDVDLESHFYVDRYGRVEQYVDTEMRADANFKANPTAVSIETWDGGDPDRIPWTPQQIEALAKLLAWLHEVHGIPLTRATAWNSPGVGGHSDYPDIWTPVRGKTCPGLARRPQIDSVISTARNLIEGEDDVATEDILRHIDAVAASLRKNLREDIEARLVPLQEKLEALDLELDKVRHQNDAIGSNVALQKTLLEVKQNTERG